MKYQIINVDKDERETVIAEFLHDSDRDICVDALQEEYPDCIFRSKDN